MVSEVHDSGHDSLDALGEVVDGLDWWDDASVINEIVERGVGISFGLGPLAEARNRGYTLATPGARRRDRKPRA